MRKVCAVGGVIVSVLLSQQTHAEEAFGTLSDVSFANKLWSVLVEERLVGRKSFQTTPYEGTEPHGFVLQTIDGMIGVGSDTGYVIVKRNYGPEGVGVDAVADDPATYLKAVTVMFQRPGYDKDNDDWFWVKYAPDGTVLTNPKGEKLAGRVAKGRDQGCIACHVNAPGGDYVFNNNRR
ncbi:MAG: cytochrome P460 family protein [Alphaproteobacteria bacterium GM7ARS4]|nr:cytochrome P460 family protein [Alphaproteobacteria bacterium GM7ARS4]